MNEIATKNGMQFEIGGIRFENVITSGRYEWHACNGALRVWRAGHDVFASVHGRRINRQFVTFKAAMIAAVQQHLGRAAA